MTTLAAALTNSATEMRVNAAVADPAEYYTIDSEVIRVLANSTTVQDGLSPERSVDTTLWQIQRGHGPTTPASHLSGATLTPFPGAGGGAGGVTVDNLTDPPAEVTTLVSVGATIIGSEATLRGKDFYAQDADPGAVGTGSVWKNTSLSPSESWWRRNVTDDGWEAHFAPVVESTGDEPADAGFNATSSGTGAAYAGAVAHSDDGAASVTISAFVDGDGAAYAGALAQTAGIGAADASPSASTAGTGAALAAPLASAAGDGDAYATSNAITDGSGNADVTSTATANTGSATAGSLAVRGAASAGMSAVVDGTSARMAFNGTPPIAIPVLPASPTEQDIADVLVALGLVTQTP